MKDTTTSPDILLQKAKCLFARLLQKILRHLLERGVLNTNTMVILEGDLNSRCVFGDSSCCEGKYVDLLWETLQDHKLQQFMCMDLPSDLQGEWKEVVPCPDPGQLQATYRFQKEVVPSALACPLWDTTSLKLGDIYGHKAEDAPEGYRQVLDRLVHNGTMKDWALYAHHQDETTAKQKEFKASRLPAATERVLYYAPAAMSDHCRWEVPRGYEVNYLHLGSDHKPVMLEASLIIGGQKPPKPAQAGNERVLRERTGSQVPADFEQTLLMDLAAELPSGESDSDSSGESVVSGYSGQVPNTFLGKMANGLRNSANMTTRRTGVRLSLHGPLNY